MGGGGEFWVIRIFGKSLGGGLDSLHESTRYSTIVLYILVRRMFAFMLDASSSSAAAAHTQCICSPFMLLIVSTMTRRQRHRR